MDDTILTLEKTAMERWRNGDPMGFVDISASDICYMDPGLVKPIIGLEEYRESMQQVIGKIHYQRSEFISPKVVKIGDTALLTYNYLSLALDPSGGVLSQIPWNTTEVYFKRLSEWKIVHSHWSFIHHKIPQRLEVPLPISSISIDYGGVLGELMKLESAAMQRWRSGDPSGYLDLYAPQVTYFDTGTPERVNSLEALALQYQKLAGKIFFPVMDFVDPWALQCGDMGVLFYRFLSTSLNPDGSVASRIPWNCTEVYSHEQGAWKIIHNHWSFIRGERV